MESLHLVPSGRGRFEVSIDGQLAYSKLKTHRFPEADEIKQLIKAKIQR